MASYEQSVSRYSSRAAKKTPDARRWNQQRDEKASSFAAKKPPLGRRFRFSWFTRVVPAFLIIFSRWHRISHRHIITSNSYLFRYSLVYLFWRVSLQCYRVHDRKTHIINATWCTYILSRNWLLRKSPERFLTEVYCVCYKDKFYRIFLSHGSLYIPISTYLQSYMRIDGIWSAMSQETTEKQPARSYLLQQITTNYNMSYSNYYCRRYIYKPR